MRNLSTEICTEHVIRGHSAIFSGFLTPYHLALPIWSKRKLEGQGESLLIDNWGSVYIPSYTLHPTSLSRMTICAQKPRLQPRFLLCDDVMVSILQGATSRQKLYVLGLVSCCHETHKGGPTRTLD